MYTKKRAYLYRHKKTLRPNHPYALLVEERVRTSRSRNVYSFDSGEHRFSSFCPFFSNRSFHTNTTKDTLRETRSNPQTGALFGTHFRRKARWWSLLACSGGTFAFAFNVVVVFGNEEAFTKGHSEGGRALLSASTKRRFVVVYVVVCVRERSRRDTRLRRELL
jgi:hypothetical protein